MECGQLGYRLAAALKPLPDQGAFSTKYCMEYMGCVLESEPRDSVNVLYFHVAVVLDHRPGVGKF